MRLRRRFLPLPQKSRFFEAPRCAISSVKKIASEPRFLLRREWVKMALAAEFPAIPSSAVKTASERRCAILVHSDDHMCTKSFLRESWSWSSFFSSGADYQRTMTICVARLWGGNLGHGRRLFLSHKGLMCSSLSANQGASLHRVTRK